LGRGKGCLGRVHPLNRQGREGALIREEHFRQFTNIILTKFLERGLNSSWEGGFKLEGGDSG